MSAASHKPEDRQRYSTKGFPSRTLQHRGVEGAGHWLVAYRKAEEQRYRNLHRRIKGTHGKCDNKRGNDAHHGNTLDAPFLLQSHCVDRPSELCTINISERKLNSVNPDDLKEFVNVAYIDASINALSLGHFSSFLSLRELNLSLNGLRNMTFDAADFPHLEVLDLSYNNLSADSIVDVGRLPRLKVLHLTGNELYHLPPSMCSSNMSPAQLHAAHEDAQFETLEVLILDDNRLNSGVFESLSQLKRLKYLNLQGNRISKIPYMQQAGSIKAAIDEQTEEEGPAHTGTNPFTDEHLKRPSQSEPTEESCGGSALPLPALHYLNLADNKIAEEDGVMAAALFPALREIDICSNPLTTQRSGDPPLLTYYLQDRLGITIRQKKKQEAMKLPVKASTDPKWKVEERIHKVSKKTSLRDAPYPVKTQGERNEMSLKKTPESLQEETQHFFVTQATDFELDLQDDEKETAESKVGQKADTVPAGLPCYEMLMDANAHPDVLEPIGIQTAVRMLEHTLKNLNVYRDSKPKLDSIQTPYREREKRIRKLPPMRPIKQPSEKVDEMIKEIKETTSIREVPLSSAVRNTTSTVQDYKEARCLLRDMKAKYKLLHEKTMEQVASIEAERNTSHNAAEPVSSDL